MGHEALITHVTSIREHHSVTRQQLRVLWLYLALIFINHKIYLFGEDTRRYK